MISGRIANILLRKKNKKKAVLVCNEFLARFQIRFGNRIFFQYLNANDLQSIKEYIISTGLYENDRYYYGHFRVNSKGIIWNRDKNFLGRYYENVYNIPDNTVLPPIGIQDIDDNCKRELLKEKVPHPDRTAVLMPVAHSIELLDNQFWKRLAMRLKDAGLYVYTNVAPGESVIPGTEALEVTPNELYYLCKRIKCVIGLRSGIMDFLIYSGVKIFDIVYYHSWYYGLHDMFPMISGRTFYIKNLPFYRIKTRLKTRYEWKMLDKFVPEKDIFYKKAHLEKTILEDVLNEN